MKELYRRLVAFSLAMALFAVGCSSASEEPSLALPDEVQDDAQSAVTPDAGSVPQGADASMPLMGLGDARIVDQVAEALRDAVAQEALAPRDWRSLRVGFIGSSTITVNGGSAAPMVGFAKAAGYQWTGDISVTMGGQDLVAFATGGPFADITTRYIRDGKYDYMVLSNRAELYDDNTINIAYASAVDLHKKVVAAGGISVIYSCYATKLRQDMAPKLIQVFQEMTRRCSDTVIDGQKHPAIYVPNTEMWLAGVAQYGLNQWFSDDVHGAVIAQYANGCLWYTFITGQDPRPLAFSERVTAEQATWVKNKAWELYVKYHPAN